MPYIGDDEDEYWGCMHCEEPLEANEECKNFKCIILNRSHENGIHAHR